MGFAESDQVDYEEEDKGEYNPSKMPKELKQDEFTLEEADEMIKLASKYKHDEQNVEEEKKISSAGFNLINLLKTRLKMLAILTMKLLICHSLVINVEHLECKSHASLLFRILRK